MRKRYAMQIVILLAVLATAIFVGSKLLGGASEAAPQGISTTTEGVQTIQTEPQPTWMTFPADREITAKQAFV